MFNHVLQIVYLKFREVVSTPCSKLNLKLPIGILILLFAISLSYSSVNTIIDSRSKVNISCSVCIHIESKSSAKSNYNSSYLYLKLSRVRQTSRLSQLSGIYPSPISLCYFMYCSFRKYLRNSNFPSFLSWS